jgi:hypothetical protein
MSSTIPFDGWRLPARRDILFGTIAAGVTLQMRKVFAKASQARLGGELRGAGALK